MKNKNVAIVGATGAVGREFVGCIENRGIPLASLKLLASGRSNPQIAESLFISPKTASVHVSNILAKLGVDSRVEAAAVAHRLGVTG